MTNIIPVIMLAFQTRVMGDRQASGLETDSTEGRTVKDTICKGFNDDRKDNCPHCGKIFWSRVTGQIKCYTLRDTIEQHNLN